MWRTRTKDSEAARQRAFTCTHAVDYRLAYEAQRCLQRQALGLSHIAELTVDSVLVEVVDELPETDNLIK